MKSIFKLNGEEICTHHAYSDNAEMLYNAVSNLFSVVYKLRDDAAIEAHKHGGSRFSELMNTLDNQEIESITIRKNGNMTINIIQNDEQPQYEKQ